MSGTPRKRRSRYTATRAILTIYPGEETLRIVLCRDCGSYVAPIFRQAHDDMHAALNALAALGRVAR